MESQSLVSVALFFRVAPVKQNANSANANYSVGKSRDFITHTSGLNYCAGLTSNPTQHLLPQFHRSPLQSWLKPLGGAVGRSSEAAKQRSILPANESCGWRRSSKKRNVLLFAGHKQKCVPNGSCTGQIRSDIRSSRPVFAVWMAGVSFASCT